MTEGFLGSLFHSEAGLTTLAGVVALCVVSVPFLGGLRLCLRAMAATRRVPPQELRRARATPDAGGEPLALLFVRVLRSSLRESAGSEGLPREFVLDASKQYVLNEYEMHYARPIGMYANLLPPIGFTGTTIGILMRLLSLNFSHQALELGSLATALVVTVLALVGFASMEAVKVFLYNRLLRCLDDAMGVVRDAEAEAERVRRADRRPAAAPATG